MRFTAPTLVVIFFLAALLSAEGLEQKPHRFRVLWKKPAVHGEAEFSSFAFDSAGGMHWFVFRFSIPVKTNDVRNIYVNADANPKTGYSPAGGSDYIISPVSGSVTAYTRYGEKAAWRSEISSLFTTGKTLVVGIRDHLFAEVPLGDEFSIMMNTAFGKVRYFHVRTTKATGETVDIALPEIEEQRQTPGRPSHPKSVTVWVADVRNKLSGPQQATDVRDLEIWGSRNEYVPFQVGLYVPGRRRGTVSLSWTRLDSAQSSVPKSFLRAQRVQQVPLWEPTDPVYKYATRNIPPATAYRLKRVPDRLLPYQEGERVTGGKGYLKDYFTSFWLTIHIPPDARPGNYRANLRIEVTSSPPKELSVRVKVLPFAIPVRPSITMCGALPRWASYKSERFPAIEIIGNNTPYQLDYDQCMADMAAHRVAVLKVSPDPVLSFSPEGKPELDFEDFDKGARAIIDELQMNAKLAMPYAVVSTGHGYRFNPNFGPIRQGAISDEFKKKYTLAMRQIADHLRQKGWLKNFYALISDEPRGDQVAEVRTSVEMIRNADSDLVPWYYGAIHEDLMDVMDTWMTGPAGFLKPEQQALVRRARERGDRVGCYNPKEIYVLNQTPAYLRTLYWWAYKADLFFMSQWTFGGAYILRNFDCRNYWYWAIWLYPPSDPGRGIWDGSIRWELTRCGLQDYEYLKLLESRSQRILKLLGSVPSEVLNGRSLSLEYVRPVAQNYSLHSQDGSQMEILKRQMAEEIVQLNQLPAFLCTYQIDQDRIHLILAGETGTRVDFLKQTIVLGGAKYAACDLNWSDLGVDHTLVFTVTRNGRTKTLRKRLFRPFSPR